MDLLLRFSISSNVDEFTLQGTFMADSPIDEVYLFLFPADVNDLNGHLAVQLPPENEKYYWSYNPKGLDNWPQDTSDKLVLPTVSFRALVYGVHSERWEYIDFNLPIGSLRLIGADFPLLRSLTLGPTHYAKETDSLDAISLFSNAPLLTQVALYNTFGPSEIQLPWSQFTSISANFLISTECTEILQHSAALQEFRCDYLDGGASGNVLPVAPLRYLHSLNLGDGSGQTELLEALTTPSLQHLTSLDDAIPSINGLIFRSHCTLAFLHVVRTLTTEATYRAIFPFIPTITVTRGGLSSP
ncbi:hypothetical protein C8J57DRAFT_1608983 [Mycena rebaudengoi]|nr:hypothetical protein C8J57DRAFT_1608983 [Mycena rebaudengoi]